MVPVIRLSEPTWNRLQQWAEPLVDNVDDVICKILDVADQHKKQNSQQPTNLESVSRHQEHSTTIKLRKGVKTPQGEYRGPILLDLYKLGGSAKINVVLTKVEERMKSILVEVDYQQIPSGVDVRWRNTAMWERNNMVNDGLLKDDSPRGIWELTEKGIAEAKKLLGLD